MNPFDVFYLFYVAFILGDKQMLHVRFTKNVFGTPKKS